MTKSLLMIEDEEAIRDMLRFALPQTEFTIYDAVNTESAESILQSTSIDVIILDWMLPGRSGIQFLSWIKQQSLLQHIPIIMLTARAEENHKVKALLTGADDYVTKPFSPLELYARIKAILRRGIVLDAKQICIGNLTIDTALCQVKANHDIVNLTAIEYRMLYFFVTHPNKIYSRDQLITHIWGAQVYIDDRTVDVQIRRLRDKLKDFDYHQAIKTVRSMGYLFQLESHEKT